MMFTGTAGMRSLSMVSHAVPPAIRAITAAAAAMRRKRLNSKLLLNTSDLELFCGGGARYCRNHIGETVGHELHLRPEHGLDEEGQVHAN